MPLKRRELLKGGLALSAATALSARNVYSAEPALAFEPRPLTWRTFEVTTQLQPSRIRKRRASLHPCCSVNYGGMTGYARYLDDMALVLTATLAEVEVGPYGTRMVRVAWTGASDRTAQIVSRVATRDRFVDFSKPGNPQPLAKADRELYLRPTKFIPTDGIVKSDRGQDHGGCHDRHRQGARDCISGSSSTPIATPRSRDAARATSSTCWRRARWAANAPT